MVKDKEDLYQQLDNLLSNKQEADAMGMRAYKVIEINSGATARTIGTFSGLLRGK